MNAYPNGYATRSLRTLRNRRKCRIEPRSAAFLLPIWRQNPDFLGREYTERGKSGGGGGQSDAPAQSGRSESPHKILFLIGLPYPARGAVKKRRASDLQRNPQAVLNALSREFTADYR
jgi:hypothetical protein